MSKSKTPPAPPVFVDNHTSRDDTDALEGHFCQVTSGDLAGVRGTFESVAEYDAKTGYPKTIVFRSRDERHEQSVVPYKDVEPVVGYNGGR